MASPIVSHCPSNPRNHKISAVTGIFQGSTKLSPVDMIHGIFVLVQEDNNAKKESYCCTEPSRMFTVDHMIHGIFVLVQEDSNAKKKVIAARNLKECLPSLPLKTRKVKRKSIFFNLDMNL